MNWFDLFNKIIVTVGFPAVLVTFLYIGRKLQVLDTLTTTVDKVNDHIGHIETRMGNIENRVTQIEVKVDVIWQNKLAKTTN